MGMKADIKTRAEVRDEAISIGSRIINEQGFREFSLRRVARELDYSVGSLYNVFENQYDFLLHINARTLDELYNYIIYKLSFVKLSGIEHLRVIAYSYLEFAQSKYNLWRLIYDDNLISTDVTPDWYIERVNRLFKIIEDSLMSVDDNIKNVGENICTLWSGVHGICALALSGKLEPVWLDTPLRLIDNLINNYIHGLSKIETSR